MKGDRRSCPKRSPTGGRTLERGPAPKTAATDPSPLLEGAAKATGARSRHTNGRRAVSRLRRVMCDRPRCPRLTRHLYGHEARCGPPSAQRRSGAAFLPNPSESCRPHARRWPSRGSGLNNHRVEPGMVAAAPGLATTRGSLCCRGALPIPSCGASVPATYGTGGANSNQPPSSTRLAPHASITLAARLTTADGMGVSTDRPRVGRLSTQLGTRLHPSNPHCLLLRK